MRYTAEGRSCFCADKAGLMEKCGVLYRRREVVLYRRNMLRDGNSNELNVGGRMSRT